MISKIIGAFRRSKEQDQELEVTNTRLDSLIAQLNGEDSWFLDEVDKCVKECVCKIDKNDEGNNSAVPI